MHACGALPPCLSAPLLSHAPRRLTCLAQSRMALRTCAPLPSALSSTLPLEQYPALLHSILRVHLLCRSVLLVGLLCMTSLTFANERGFCGMHFQNKKKNKTCEWARYTV